MFDKFSFLAYDLPPSLCNHQ